ncbi:MAG: DUF2780 domain-containing protein, partial [Cyanothece sp. SIO1E1]|nr:DUF2780 domain-containing protein [Cyanothece sp. SIO1E1]
LIWKDGSGYGLNKDLISTRTVSKLPLQRGGEDFAQIAQSVPGLGEMLQSAPGSNTAGGGMLGALGGLASAVGGEQASGLSNLLSLAGGFSELGLDSSMIGKFVPIILSYVQGQGGDTIKDLLAQVLK